MALIESTWAYISLFQKATESSITEPPDYEANIDFWIEFGLLNIVYAIDTDVTFKYDSGELVQAIGQYDTALTDVQVRNDRL